MGVRNEKSLVEKKVVISRKNEITMYQGLHENLFGIPASKLVLGLGLAAHLVKHSLAMHENLSLIVSTS